jgi:hypothetical protein
MAITPPPIRSSAESCSSPTSTMTMLKEGNFTCDGHVEPHQFSFDHATLEKNLRINTNFFKYKRANPATWPLITQDIIDKHCGGTYT